MSSLKPESPRQPRTSPEHPEGRGTTAHALRGHRTLPARWVLPPLIALLATAFAVFMELPEWVSTHRGLPSEHRPEPAPPLRKPPDVPPPARPAPPSNPTQAPTTTAPESAGRAAAERALADFLRELAPLEDAAVPRWANADYVLALAGSELGDQSMKDGAYDRAAAHYSAAASSLSRVASRLPQIVESEMAAAEAAFRNGDPDAASEAFGLVLAIDPAHGGAADGLQQAQARLEASALLHTARAQESDGQIETALQTAQNALAVDPRFEAARQTVDRIDAKVREQVFSSAMTLGLSALESGRLQAALRAFDAALAARPDSADAQQGANQAREGIRLARIEGHRRNAAVFTAQEQWKEAAAEYQAALDIDPTLVFARRGKRDSEKLADLSAQIEYLLRDPASLTSERVLDTAMVLYREARQHAPEGSRFAARLNELDAQLSAASQPVRVEIRSDNATEIAIFRYGRLGRFFNLSVDLRPGTYTVVGSRPGYRDVRRTLTLTPGGDSETLFVACEEAI